MTDRTEVTGSPVEPNRRDKNCSPHHQRGSRKNPFLESAAVTRRAFLIAAGTVAGSLMFKRSVAHGKTKTLVGFIVPQESQHASETESLIAGFELFLKEKNVSSMEVLRKTAGEGDKDIAAAVAEMIMKHEVRFLVSPPTFKGSEKCVHGVPPGKLVLFVTNPAVRLVSGEMCIPGAFRLSPNTYQSARPLAPWALTNLGRKVYITGRDDAQGNEEADFFAYGFEKAGGKFVDRRQAAADGRDLESIVDAIGQSDADFVFASFRGEMAKTFLTSIRTAASGQAKPVVGPECLTSYPSPLKDMGAPGLGVKSLGTVKDPVAFTKRVKGKTGKRVGNAVRAAEGYDIASVVFEATKTQDAAQGETDNLIKSIEKMEIRGPRGKIVFDKNHEPILDVFVRQWASRGGALRQEIVQELGTAASRDFGCGRVGFPKKTDLELQDEKRREEQEE
ncbi:MAG: ABC transporter substrate-binding protein [Pseudomonadota bacterium]